MNPIKQLSIEYDGIYGLIDAYTSNAAILNALTQLKIALENQDFEAIVYTLDVILDWYARNLNDILDNEYVMEPDQHQETRDLLVDIRFRITPEDCTPTQQQDIPEEHNNSLIFISHKSDDKQYGHILRDFLSGLGVPNNRIIYTSHPLHKIPLDKNIYDYLRSNINSSVFMIILWSNKYLDSPACLNEMGAAWVVQSDYTNIYVPDFSFGNPKYRECAVDTAKMGAVLNGDEHCRASLIELKNKVVEMFNLKVDEQTVVFLLDKLTEELRNIKKADGWLI